MTQAEAEPVIKAKLIEEKAKSLAVAEANAIAAKVKQANSIAAAGVPFQDLGIVTRQDSKLSDDERGVAFSQPAVNNQLAVMTRPTVSGASVIVGGVISNDNAQITPQVKQQTAQIVRENIGQSQFEDYLAYLKSITKVTIKPQTAAP